MMDAQALREISDSAMETVAQRVLCMPMRPLPEARLSSGRLCCLEGMARGDYAMEAALCADAQVMELLAQAMRRGRPVGDEGLSDYTIELFNILFGRMVSTINHRTGVSARFGLPRFFEGEPQFSQEAAGRPDALEQTFHYGVTAGILELRVRFAPPA